MNNNYAFLYLTGNCNFETLPDKKQEDLELVSLVSARTGLIGVVVYQIPNCPIVYSSDPSVKLRSEDAVIAWGWKEYLDNYPNYSPQWLARLPMTKAGLQCGRAVEEYLQTNFKWIVGGASKRGWTTWNVGFVSQSILSVAALLPLVPIVPSIQKAIHIQRKSYGGLTWAFKDYFAVNISKYIDSEAFLNLTKMNDPIYHLDALSNLPKYIIYSSDDEFAQFDWTALWYTNITADSKTRLFIPPDSEHSLITGLPDLIPSLIADADAISSGTTNNDELPSIDLLSINTSSAVLTIRLSLPPNYSINDTVVVLRHATTISSVRRDFRWVRHVDYGNSSDNDPCNFPEIYAPSQGDGNCITPIRWRKSTPLRPSNINTSCNNKTILEYVAQAPAPTRDGYWVGYYIEARFPKTHFHLASPGYVYPDIYPFPDCYGSNCVDIPV
eukprot:CAMPEP_0197321060 /NCGR_PEP_ID=MMETSP0891-20130614/63017_1 /TAXON_ID=44058 ORGANISM="Aureoumbra lagunensis, Strain CCMP1510" /NCGR_SAMPLE_ID=MMETSP0891 /ASSEMBLY_ACC=CAM_ASM_000534 /LENGTH=440 /DNA_ID=CAMNT_0042812729 /DNA_START=288 /DNA_END=1610 /DNA_ORIENTATION=-